jgi:hypothetical protein
VNWFRLSNEQCRALAGNQGESGSEAEGKNGALQSKMPSDFTVLLSQGHESTPDQDFDTQIAFQGFT